MTDAELKELCKRVMELSNHNGTLLELEDRHHKLQDLAYTAAPILASALERAMRALEVAEKALTEMSACAPNETAFKEFYGTSAMRMFHELDTLASISKEALAEIRKIRGEG